MFGRARRSLLRPFSDRRYTKGAPRHCDFPDELRDVILPWVACISNTTPRRVIACTSHPVLVYTDAPGAGHVGCVVFVDGIRTMAHTHLPAWFRDIIPGIYEYEPCADISGLALETERAPDRPAFLCCDNVGAVGTVIRGARRANLGRTIVSVFWAVDSALGTAVWIEYVATKLNCSDEPSRRCHKALEGLCSRVAGANGAPPACSDRFSRRNEICITHCAGALSRRRGGHLLGPVHPTAVATRVRTARSAPIQLPGRVSTDRNTRSIVAEFPTLKTYRISITPPLHFHVSNIVIFCFGRCTK